MATSQEKPPAPFQLKSSSVNHSKPSLPFLLCDYGFEDPEKEKQRKKKEEERERRREAKRQKMKQGGTAGAINDDRELEREEHYLKMVRDIYRLRDYYYDEYNSLLAEKVSNQRREIRQRDAEMRKKREDKAEEERKATHSVKKRLDRQTLDSTPVTGPVPKTDLYYIVGLEDKLRKEGKLKTTEDVNKFRLEIQDPRVFYANFKVNKHTDYDFHAETSTEQLSGYSLIEANDNVHSLNSDIDNLGYVRDPHQRSLSRISETREGSRPGTQMESWAVTQQFPPQHRRSRKSLGPTQLTKTKSNYQSDLEKRFPKLEMPNLHCFNMDLSKKPPDPEEVRLKQELRAREKHRKKMARTYVKMHQLAMTNAATTARIMDGHEDIDMFLNGPDLCDVIADNHWMEAYGIRELEPTLEVSDVDEQAATSPRQDALPVDSSSQLLAVEGSDDSKIIAKAESKPGSRKTSAASQKSLPVELAPKPMPLTLGEIQGNCQVVEAKTLSTLWNNYLRVGRERTDNALKLKA